MSKYGVLTLALGLAFTSSAQARPLTDNEAIVASYRHVANVASEFGFTDVNRELSPLRVQRDSLGQIHVRLDQVERGIPVFGGQMIVHMDSTGRLLSMTDGLTPVAAVPNIKATLRPGEALRVAQAAFARGVVTPDLDLVWFEDMDGDVHLAYSVRMSDLDNNEPASHQYMIDARTGSIVFDWDDLHTGAAQGTGNSYYSGEVEITTNQTLAGAYEMVDPDRGNSTTTNLRNTTSGNGDTFTDADNVWGTGVAAEPTTLGVDAHYGAAVTVDLYRSAYDRDGIRDDGKGALSRVHYGVGYNNAFWDDSCFCMTYGDGDGRTFDPFESLDVAGHEQSHGVTSNTSGLVYYGDAGGMNEGFSDIMGTMVEFYAAEHGADTTGDYYIGEDIYTPAIPGDALRYMDNPTKDGYSIDNASKMRAWTNPHYSSGVPNNVFYLASEGGRNKTSGKTVTNPIGRDKVGAIFYRAVAFYMTPRSSFSDQRKATEKAATDLYTQSEATLMGTAWDACGVK